MPVPYKTGKKPPVVDDRIPRMSVFTRGRLAPAPPKYDWSTKVTNWGMLGNDTWGDCVEAAILHWIMQMSAFAGHPLVATTQDAEQFYEFTGFKFDDPSTDNGTYMLGQNGAIPYWHTHGVMCGGQLSKVAGFLQILHKHPEEWKQGIYYFGGLLTGIQLPASILGGDNVPEVWSDFQGPSDGGHEILICLTGDTKVPLLDGTEVELGTLTRGEQVWVYSCTPDGRIVPGHATALGMTRENAEILTVELDNGAVIRCTPDHQFMLRNGLYVNASELRAGSSLMPLYRELSATGYERCFSLSDNVWVPTHHLMVEGGWLGKEFCVHHKNFLKRDNRPANLENLTWQDHTELHAKYTVLLEGYAKSERGRARSRELMTKLWSDPEWAQATLKKLHNLKPWERAVALGRCGLQTMDKDQLRRMTSENGKKAEWSSERRAKAGLRLKRYLEREDPDVRRAFAMKGLAAAQAANAKGLTEAQLAARRRNIKVAHAVRLAQNNHKVVSVRTAGFANVYDLSVAEHHNFAVSAGVFVHNCGYTPSNRGTLYKLVSWGQTYMATELFLRNVIDEMVVVIDPIEFDQRGVTALNLNMDQLTSDMSLLRRVAQ